MFVCLHVCMYWYVLVCIGMCVYTYMCLYVWYVGVCIYMCVFVYWRMFVYVYYVCSYVGVCICVRCRWPVKMWMPRWWPRWQTLEHAWHQRRSWDELWTIRSGSPPRSWPVSNTLRRSVPPPFCCFNFHHHTDSGFVFVLFFSPFFPFFSKTIIPYLSILYSSLSPLHTIHTIVLLLFLVGLHYTLHTTHYTLHSTLYTLHATCYMLHATCYTYTLHTLYTTQIAGGHLLVWYDFVRSADTASALRWIRVSLHLQARKTGILL